MVLTKERKIILIVAAILLPLAAIYRFAPSAGIIQPLGEEIAVKKKQLLKYQIAAQEKGVLTSELEAMTRVLIQTEGGLLTGGTPALAAVDIQNTLNQIAESTGVDLTLARPLPPEKKEEEAYLTGIPLFVRFNADIHQLERFLFRVENSSKILTISQLRIRIVNLKQPDLFQVEMAVEGYMKLIEAL